MADENSPNPPPNYNFVPGTLNPSPFGSKHKVYSSSMITDDPLRTHNKIMSSNIAPDQYESSLTYNAVIVGVDYADNEESTLYQRLKSVLGSLGVAEVNTTVYYCMIPELHGHLVNPLTIDPSEHEYHEDAITHQFPEFHIAAGSEVKEGDCIPGSIVTVQFVDGAKQYGQITRMVKPNDDPNPPRSLAGAMSLFNEQDFPPSSPAPAAPAYAGTGEMEPISCAGPTIRIDYNRVKLLEPAAAFLKMVGPWLPDNTKISSSSRSSKGQSDIIKYYGKSKLNIDPATIDTAEKVEALRKKLVAKPTPGLYIGRVASNPDAPNEAYAGHYGGLAIDFSGVALSTLEKHLREAEQYMPSVIISMLLVENSNGCVHVQFPSTTTYNADELYSNWTAYTGCPDDPNLFPIVANTVANYTLGPPPDALAAPAPAPDNSDQSPSDLTTSQSSPSS
jgi:hypothetical protein